MTTNEQLNEMGLATVDRRALLPMATNIVGRKGKVLGTVQHFTGNRSATDVKLALKASNPKLSGKALAAKVNEVLSGEVDLRQQLGLAWLQAAFQSGWTCDAGVLRKSRGGLNLVRVAKAPEAPVKSVEEKRMEALELLGLTEADFVAMKQLTEGK